MKFLKNTALVFVSSLISFFFAYLFHFYTGRILGPENYGLFSVGFNIYAIFTFALTTVVIAVSKYTAIFKAQNEYGKIRHLLALFLKGLFLSGLLTVFVFYIFNRQISDLFGGGVSNFIVFVGLAILASFVSSVFPSFLQGFGDIFGYSVISIIGGFVKFVATFIFLHYGLGIVGAYLGLSVSNIAVVLLGFLFSYKIFFEKTVKISRKSLLSFSLPVFITNVLINSLFYIDLFFVKIFFGAEKAGFYGAASNLSKAMLVVSSVLVVFFPEFSKDHALKNIDLIKKKFLNALVYVVLLSLPILLFFNIFPQMLVEFTYSGSFIDSVTPLRVLGFATFAYVIFNVITYALWAVDEQNFVMFSSLFFFFFDLILLRAIVPVYGLFGASVCTAIVYLLLSITNCFKLLIKLKH